MGAFCLPTGEPTEGVQAQIFESKEGVVVKNPTVPVGHKKPNQKQPGTECPYQEMAGMIALALMEHGVEAGRIYDLTVEHDDWCPIIGGDGSRECEPTFKLDGISVEIAP
jgi:hypothetical protein